ncbi:MAG: hypothetical protein ACU0BK_11730 [Shimia sp.]|uniref:hypothetical protein n=1 Tax=Shimia sp. TaxID=1954381 RepID=UPI004058C725
MALNHLALLYWDGDYTDKDLVLAEIYRDGTLVGADPKQYLKYLKRAANQGNAAAKKAWGVE